MPLILAEAPNSFSLQSSIEVVRLHAEKKQINVKSHKSSQRKCIFGNTVSWKMCKTYSLFYRRCLQLQAASFRYWILILPMNMKLYWNQPLTPLRTLRSACSDLCSFRGSLHYLFLYLQKYSPKNAKKIIRNSPTTNANIILRFVFGFMGYGFLVGA